MMYTKKLIQLIDQLDKRILDAEAHLTAHDADGLEVGVSVADIRSHIPDHLLEVEEVSLIFFGGSIQMFVYRVGTTEARGEPIIDLPIKLRTILAGYIPDLIELLNLIVTNDVQQLIDRLDEILEVEDCCAEA